MGTNRKEKDGWFVVTYIHRDDVVDALIGESDWGVAEATNFANSLTDDDMRLIAENMADNYVGYGSFWYDLAYQAEEMREENKNG